MHVFRVVAVAACLGVMASSCVSAAQGDTDDNEPRQPEGAESTQPTPTPGSDENTPAFVASADCELVQDLYNLPLIEEAMPISELDAQLDKSQELLERLSKTEVGDIEGLSTYVQLDMQAAKILQESWGTDGSGLLEKARQRGETATQFAVAKATLQTDGADWSYFDYASLGSKIFDHIFLACINQPNALPIPEHITTKNFPEMSLSAQEIADPQTPALLRVVNDDIEIEPIQRVIHSVSTDGSQGLAVDNDGQLVVIDMATLSEETLTWAGDGWTCPAWTLDQTAILGTRFVLDDAIANDLSMATLDSKDVATHASPSADFCPVDVGNGTIVFVGDDKIYTTSPGEGFGKDRTPLWESPTCSFATNEDRVTSGSLSFVANCRNPYEDGLYDLDLDTGQTNHLLAGSVGVGSTTFDGSFRAFTYRPLGQADGPFSLHLASTDFTQVWDTSQAYAFPLIID